MRLICPNCDAQYEVPDEVMPASGRDVQCSDCGHTWFQEHPDQMDGDANAPSGSDKGTENPGRDPDEEVVRADAAMPSQSPPPPPPRQSKPKPEPQPKRPEPSQPEEPKRKTLDPTVAEILQQEAELEANARRKSAPSTLETQPDLGLEDAPDTGEAARRSREARDRMARIRGETPPSEKISEAEATAAAIGSRRDLLPDIEEINSTLRSNSDRAASGDPAATAAVEHQQKQSGRRGFIFAIALVAILAALYVYAPQLAEAVPQADPWISAYVATIDQIRIWLNTQAQALLGWLDAAATSSGN